MKGARKIFLKCFFHIVVATIGQHRPSKGYEQALWLLGLTLVFGWNDSRFVEVLGYAS